MLGRLKRKGFIEAERVGKRKFIDQLNGEKTPREKTVVRVLHPKHGWMYEKIVEDDEAASDAAVDKWAERANRPVEKAKRIGAE
jgi:type IV secretory pathway ATPase VirB11/archaellum biosynthesis ATPase